MIIDNNKQTAVGQLIESLGWNKDTLFCQKYLEIERQQTIDFANNYGFDVCGYDYERAEQYYNETFGDTK
jgi:hypothetical protein